MKKIISLLVIAFMATTTFAQSQADLARQQRELNNLHMKLANAKVTKDAKKQAKALRKEGWMEPAGEASIDKQLTKAQLYGEEMMTNLDGSITPRFLPHTAMNTAGTYNAAYAAARSACMTEVASMLETKLASAWKENMDNAQQSATTSITNDKFNERSMGVVNQSISNMIPTVAVYRVLPNGNYQVQVRVVFDKKEIADRMKRSLQKELEMQGDKLDGMVEDIICKGL